MSAQSQILELRLRLGVTQVELAEKLGVDRRTYQRAEQHGRRPLYVLAIRHLLQTQVAA